MNKVLYIGLCDDEQHIHDIVGKMIKEYGDEKKCELKVIHFFQAKKFLSQKKTFRFFY